MMYEVSMKSLCLIKVCSGKTEPNLMMGNLAFLKL